MRVHTIGILVAAVAAGSAFGQALLCPPSATPSTHACETFHYHVQMYRPDTRGFLDLFGVNEFATQNACDRAREAAVRHNLAVVDFYRRQRNDQRYEPDRFGPCHCDMTVERTSSNYLNDVARTAQIRLAADTRMRVRERLIDADVPTDSDLIRNADPAPAPLIGGPKLVPLPAAPPVVTAMNAPSDLKMPKSPDSGAPSMSSLDLPLVEIPIAPTAVATVAAAEPVPPVTAPATQPTAQPPAPAPEPVPPPPVPPSEPVARTGEAPVLHVQAEEPPQVDDAAEAFISVETDRIQKVLAASGALTDDSARVKVLEACSKRLQLLSNLRSLIEGSGTKGRLAAAARAAREESDRLALVAKLFGSDMPAHWAPKDARDVVVDLVADPEKVLRDSRASAQDKRHALYAFLATSTPTDEQQMWLMNVIEGLLQ
jgi:hypothetical protein